MKTLNERRANFAKASERLSELDNAELAKLVAAGRLGDGLGVFNYSKIELGGVPVFVKEVPLTDLEKENPQSTKNLFNLPTFYQYGIGSSGFGVWRELESHKMANDWVLRDECPNFPLMYGHRVVEEKPSQVFPPDKVDEFVRKRWANSPEIKRRIEAMNSATNKVFIFLEKIPHNMQDALNPQKNIVRPNMEMVEDDVNRATEFMLKKGMIHFDAHHRNMLTDGERVYFSDFGLALSKEFDLSDAEREFFENHRGIDRALAFQSLARQEINNAKELIPLLPEVAELSKRYEAANNAMDRFCSELQKSSDKKVPYPRDEMDRVFAEIKPRTSAQSAAVAMASSQSPHL